MDVTFSKTTVKYLRKIGVVNVGERIQVKYVTAGKYEVWVDHTLFFTARNADKALNVAFVKKSTLN